jgi:1-acyl-sn-glycerol-3-phosphate acyltransferase
MINHVRAVLRFSAFLCATAVIYASWWIGSAIVPNKQYWRQLAFKLWTSSFVKISGMTIEVIGAPPNPPFFLVVNHLSYVDIAVIRAVVTGVFVAKAEIDDWFVAGRLVRDMGNIFIDRQNRRDIPRAGRKILERLDEGEGVVIFPEGTSTKGEDVLPFNSSFLEFAAASGLPVSYASITYRTPSGGPTPSERICWWDDTAFIPHMIRLFSLKRYTAVIRFGDERVQDENRKKLAADLHDRVKENFIPML